MKKSPGYILILSFFIIAMAVALISAIIQKTFNYQRLSTISLDIERARLIAFGSINLAIDQVSYIESKEPKSKQNDTKTPDGNAGKKAESIEQKRLSKLLDIINKWQSINLSVNQEGIDAEIKLYIACEQGKINLKTIYEAQQKSQKEGQDDKDEKKGESEERPSTGSEKKPEEKNSQKTFEKAIDEAFTQKVGISFIKALKSNTKTLGRFIEDPSELFDAKSFQSIKDKVFMFYGWPEKNPKEEKSLKEKISLMDLFTVWPGSGKLNPWLLSDATLKILGLSSVGKKNSKELVKKYKPKIDWKVEWDNILEPIYGKKFGAIPKEISDQFASDFEALSFSIICYVKVGSARQGICAILEKDEPSDDQKSQEKSNDILFKISKIYWL